MKKTLLIVFCVIFSLLPFSFIVYADPVSVVSPMQQPVPTTINNGDGTVTYKEYYVVQRAGNTLYELTITCPDTSDATLRLDNNTKVMINLKCSPSDVSYVRMATYDINTGAFLEQYVNIGNITTDSAYVLNGFSCAVTFRTGYFPKQNPYSDTEFVAGYPIIDIPTSGNRSDTNATPFVTWSEAPLEQIWVRSVLPEPVADEYNRYIVIVGQNESYLLWLNLHLAGIDAVLSQTSATYDHYDIRQYGYFAPYFRKSNDGYDLRVEMDPVLWLYLQNLGYDGDVSIYWKLTEFNLLTGEFVSSIGNTINDMQPNVYYDLTGNINIENVNGISLYGINYVDTSDEHLHRAAVIYGVDPSFEIWKSDVLTWLERIYGSMSQEAETVTIADDTQALEEMESAKDALQVTDANGDPVDQVQQVEMAFSEAASGIGSIGGGISSVNGLIGQLFEVSPLVIVPIIVALALGLVVTILGKNKSD